MKMRNEDWENGDIIFTVSEMNNIISLIYNPIINGEPSVENMHKKYYHGVDPLSLAKKFEETKKELMIWLNNYAPHFHENSSESLSQTLNVNLNKNEFEFLLEVIVGKSYSGGQIRILGNKESQDKHSTIQKKWELLWMKIHGYYNKHCGVEANENPYRVFCAYSETDKKLTEYVVGLRYYQDGK
jgi:hypothetical protein